MTFWNDERNAEASRLWHEGNSASEIAAIIGAPSRNAVIGKLTRLGLGGGGRRPKLQAARLSVLAPPPEVRPVARPHPGNIARKADSRALDAGATATSSGPEKRLTRPAVSFGNAVRKVQSDADQAAEQPAWCEALDANLRKTELAFGPIEGGKTLLDLKACDCRWPHGEIGADEFRFCGEVKDIAEPYCAGHMRIAINPAFRRARERADA